MVAGGDADAFVVFALDDEAGTLLLLLLLLLRLASADLVTLAFVSLSLRPADADEDAAAAFAPRFPLADLAGANMLLLVSVADI